MTQDVLDKAERRKIASIAKQYRNKGYRVTLQPRGTELPTFLREFDIDLLVQGEDENVAVEVKSRQSLSEANDLPQLAHVLQDRPGWRLELVVTRARGTERRVDGQTLLTRQEILLRLREAEELLRQRLVTAAMLLAWTAAEAALRRSAQLNNVEIAKPESVFLVAQTYSMGLMDKDQYDLLTDAANAVNGVIHGYSVGNSSREQVVNIISAAEQILNC